MLLASLRLVLADDKNLLNSVFLSSFLTWVVLVGGGYGALRLVWDAARGLRRASRAMMADAKRNARTP